MAWSAAAQAGARLDYLEDEYGRIEVQDGRDPSRPLIVHSFTWAQSDLYRFLDDKRSEGRLCSAFRQDWPAAYATLGGDTGINDQVEAWKQEDLVLRIGGYVFGLAVRRQPRPKLGEQVRKPSEELSYA